MYRENDVEIEPAYAGLLCAGIISDTLILRSPTTLREDKIAAAALAKIAGIDLAEFGAELFHASVFTGENDPISLIFRDFKTYNVNAITFGIGQVNFMDRESLDAKKSELLPALEAAASEKGLKMIFVMLTDIGASNSDVIFYGDDAADLLENAFEKTPDDSSLFIEGLVSRKKQLVPEILSEMQN
jgi:manganese-dependent inorganic pyrophosphatase